MVEIERSAFGRRKVRKSAGDGADALGDLVRVNQVSVIAMQNQRRADGGFLSLDDGSLNRERQEDVGIADRVVVKEVPHAGVEVGEAGDPVLAPEW